MATTPPSLEQLVRQVHVDVAELAVLRGEGMLVTSGLGSCIAVALYDPVARVGGLAHILLPHDEGERMAARPTKFAATAVPLLLAEMRHHGSRNLPFARLAGGAQMFSALMGTTGVNMGGRNTEAARAALAAAGVTIIAEDTGGDHGRSVYLDVATGVLRVHSLRRGERFL